MLVRPPGPPVNWTYVLPDGLHADPEVVVMFAPAGAREHARKCEVTGTQYGVMEHRGKETGIQVFDEKVKTMAAAEEFFYARGIELTRVHYIGKLSGIPNRLVLASVFSPILLLTEAPWRPFINLRRAVRRVTINEDNVN